MMDGSQLANAAASALVALCSLVFAVVYHLRAPWRSTSVGRHIMTFTLAIGALCLYTVLVTIWPEGAFATVARLLRTVLLVVIAGLIVQRTGMVRRAQRHANAEHADRHV